MWGSEYDALFLGLVGASAGTAYLADSLTVFIDCIAIVLVLRAAVWAVDTASKVFAGRPLMELARIGNTDHG